jgi:Amt family ammonium transporter
MASGEFGIPGPDGADTTTTIEGLFYGGGLDQLKAQFIGSLTAVVVISAAAAALMYAVKATKTLRVDADGELEGLDIFEHGTAAYHMEFGQGMTYSSPVGSGPLGVPKQAPAETEESEDTTVGTTA